MSEDVRQATCVAATDAKCLDPLQEGFVRMLGNLQGLLDGSYLRAAHLLDCNVTASAAAAQGSKAKGPAPQTRQSRKTMSTGTVRQRLRPGQARHGERRDRRRTHAGAGGPRCRPNPCASAFGRVKRRPGACRPLQAAVRRHQVPLWAGHRRQQPPGTRRRRRDPLHPRVHGAMQDGHTIYFLLKILLGGTFPRPPDQGTVP